MAFDHPERRAKGKLQGEFLLGVLRRRWEALKQLQPFCEVTDRFMVGRALDSTLARALPIGDGLHASTRLRVVIGQQFGLRLGYLWELRFQHLRDACMVLLPRTPHEGLIRHLLGEDML